MKEKEFDRIVRELEHGKKELIKHGITFCLSGHNTGGQTWYVTNEKERKE